MILPDVLAKLRRTAKANKYKPSMQAEIYIERGLDGEKAA